MKYGAYEQYKPSGVAWLDSVPSHWKIKAARHGYSIQLGKMLQPESSSPEDVETVYLKSQHVQWESVRVDDLPLMWASPTDIKKYGVSDGDLLVCEGGDVGRAGIIKSTPPNTIIQNALHRVRPRSQHDIRFLMYVLEHATGQSWFEIICNRSTIAHFTGEKFDALRVPEPPFDEQQTIVCFLDAKTAQIDALMGQKRLLIDKLNEKRSALIARSVTRGLSPKVGKASGLVQIPQINDAGLGMLGEVPERWKVLPLRRLVKFVKTGNTPNGVEDYHFEKDGFSWYSPSDFSEYVFLGASNRALSAEGKAQVRVFPGMTVMLVGIGATIGKVGLPKSECSCNQQINAIGCNSKLHPVFATYYLKILRDFILKCGKFTTLPIINQDETKNLLFAAPPLVEQADIAAYLDRETVDIDSLIYKIEAAISRLTEYRQALITAAVTGKIDLRAFAA